MRLSREKINYLSHIVVKTLWESDEVDFKVDINQVRLGIACMITEELEIEDKVDEKVHQFLESYSRNIEEGSTEWTVLYEKKYEEEMKKLRGDYDILPL